MGNKSGNSRQCLEFASKLSPSATTDTTYEATRNGYGRAGMVQNNSKSQQVNSSRLKLTVSYQVMGCVRAAENAMENKKNMLQLDCKESTLISYSKTIVPVRI